jgi:hypothetical protein
MTNPTNTRGDELKALPCPFCGTLPHTGPDHPEYEGSAWGFVECQNKACQAKPRVVDGVCIADGGGSDAYKQAAIVRWNTRSGDSGMVLVPREPTDAMIESICNAHSGGSVWPTDYGTYAQGIRREQARVGYLSALRTATAGSQGGDT